jgi:hypothetical protein
MPSLDPKREAVNPDDRLILTPSMIPQSRIFDTKKSQYFKNSPTYLHQKKYASKQGLNISLEPPQTAGDTSRRAMVLGSVDPVEDVLIYAYCSYS